MHTLEVAMQDAYEVDYCVHRRYQAFKGLRVVDVGFNHIHRGQENQLLGPLAIAGGYPDLYIERRELAHDVAAEQTAAAE